MLHVTCYKQDFFSKISTISFNEPTLLKQTEIGVQGGRSFTTKIATLFNSGRTCETYLQPILVPQYEVSQPSSHYYSALSSGYVAGLHAG